MGAEPSPSLTKVEIWTDGSCVPTNPGRGGWGAILLYGRRWRLELAGAEFKSTNNRMELMAPIQALEALKRPCAVKLHSDSKYVVLGMTKWIGNWQRKNWRGSRAPVKNRELWQRLLKASEPHQVEWIWVKAHIGIRLNEDADQLAKRAARSQKEWKQRRRIS